MRLSNSFFYTLRENVKDEESKSANLLVKSGMIKKTSAGVYMFLPLGFKVLKNIECVIREEMNAINSSELLMPSLISEDVFKESKRSELFGKDMFRLKDRFNKDMVLAPTHEELFTIASLNYVKSYKDLPYSLYQFQNKFRDEPRPRFGLIRVREFIMKDAYSFDIDSKGLDKSYNDMFNAYKKIFARLGIKYRVVKSDVGAMGGILSEEFQAITDIGEDLLVYCDKCDFSSNIDIAECKTITKKLGDALLPRELIKTENAGTIEEVSQLLSEASDKFVKTLIYDIDNNLYAILIKGDDEVNTVKLRRLLNAKSVELANYEEVEEVTQAKMGYAGPINLDIPIIIDNEVANMSNFIVGANKTDYHYKHVNLEDFNYVSIADIRNIKENDRCPMCGNNLKFTKGIEVGNTFKLGTKYSKAMDLQYVDNKNVLKLVEMGSYGIGVGRCLAAIVEQNSDEKGIVWPMEITPYKVIIVVIDINNNEQKEAANHLYNQLKDLNIDALLDDREERPGVKFNDADLIGIPLRVTIGKKINDHILELKTRTNDKVSDISLFDIVDKIQNIIEE